VTCSCSPTMRIEFWDATSAGILFVGSRLDFSLVLSSICLSGSWFSVSSGFFGLYLVSRLPIPPSARDSLGSMVHIFSSRLDPRITQTTSLVAASSSFKPTQQIHNPQRHHRYMDRWTARKRCTQKMINQICNFMLHTCKKKKIQNHLYSFHYKINRLLFCIIRCVGEESRKPSCKY
jgi:hypothetical protein